MRSLPLVLALLGACSTPAPVPSSVEPEPIAAPAPPVADDLADPGQAPDPTEVGLKAAREALPALGGALKTRLQGAMAEGGPDAAVKVCADEAQAIGRRVADETGVKVGRSSLRLRNPDNAAPDWVSAWLVAQGERKAEGVEGFDRVDIVGEARFARVVRPIAVDAMCVTCHGPIDTVPESVGVVLAERYPSDAAVGYAVGDLRGALWAEASIR